MSNEDPLTAQIPGLEANRAFLEGLRSVQGVFDLQRIVEQAKYPIFLIVNQQLEYRLWAINVGVMEGAITGIEAAYVRLAQSKVTDSVIVSTLLQDKQHQSQAFHRLSMLSALKSALGGYMPARYRSKIPQDNRWRDFEVEQLWLDKLAPGLAFGKPLASQFLTLTAQSWDLPVPLSIGYADIDKLRVIVVSIGPGWSEFMALIASLVSFTANDRRLAKLQEEQVEATNLVASGPNPWV